MYVCIGVLGGCVEGIALRQRVAAARCGQGSATTATKTNRERAFASRCCGQLAVRQLVQWELALWERAFCLALWELAL